MTSTLETFRKELQSLLPGEVGPAVELLAATLDQVTARVLRLAAIPHQFTFDLLPVLLPSLTRSQAQEVGERLVRLSVIVQGDQEFAVHDDVRGYLFSGWLQTVTLGDGREFTEVSARLVDHWKQRLEHATDRETPILRHRIMFHRIGADPDSGYEDFIELLGKARNEHRLDDCERLIALVQEYQFWLPASHQLSLDYQVGKLLADRRLWNEASTLFQMVSSDGNASQQLTVKALTRLGTTYARNENWTRAIQHFDRAFTIASKDETCRKERGWILHEWGLALRDMGDTSKAEELLMKRVEMARSEANWIGLAAGTNALGSLYRKLNDHHKAIAAFEEALRHLLENGETFRSAQVYNNLGLSLANIGEWKESQKYLDRSLAIKEAAGDTRGQAISLSNLMCVYWNLGQRREAGEAGKKATDLFLEINEVARAALVSRDAARLARREQRVTAEHAYNKAIELFTRAGMEADASAARHELAGGNQEHPLTFHGQWEEDTPL
jgi:tetratricopeptide (TPR) repeat protein